MSAPIMKAGWLWRQSKYLKTWKKQWFALSADGYFRYFEKENDPVAEETLYMRSDCRGIRAGTESSDVKPPDGETKDSLFFLDVHDGNWTLCAESKDDMLTWKLILEEARHRPTASSPQPRYAPAHAPTVYIPPRYANIQSGQIVYPQQQQTYITDGGVVYATGYPQYVVGNPYGGTNVIYVERDRGFGGAGFGTGMLAGAAVGSMMWWPFMWC